MRQTFSIMFFLKRRHKIEDKSQTIVARITANGESSEFSTHLKCCIKDWKFRTKQAKGRGLATLTLNSSLHDTFYFSNNLLCWIILHFKSLHDKGIRNLADKTFNFSPYHTNELSESGLFFAQDCKAASSYCKQRWLGMLGGCLNKVVWTTQRFC